VIDTQELFQSIGKADKIWHLGQASLLSGLSGGELLRISGLFKDQIHTRGEIIFDQGDSPAALYLLNRGSVRLSMTNEDQREKTLKILKRGDIFGLESIGHDGQSNVRATAHEESWVSVLTRDQFLNIAIEQPSLYFNFIQILLLRLADAREDVKALCFMDTQERLAQTLLKLAHTHGQQVASRENMVRVRVRLSHDYLAGMISSNRPYLSNIMSSFKKQGWISYKNQYLLVDIDALQNIVG